MADESQPVRTADGASRVDDWPSRTTQQVVDVVDRVRAATTDNIMLVVRGLVYGLVLTVVALTMLVMIVILLVRVADAYLPIGDGVGSATWAAHAFVGVPLTALGLGAWASRSGSNRPILISAVLCGVSLMAIVLYGIVDGLT